MKCSCLIQIYIQFELLLWFRFSSSSWMAGPKAGSSQAKSSSRETKKKLDSNRKHEILNSYELQNYLNFWVFSVLFFTLLSQHYNYKALEHTKNKEKKNKKLGKHFINHAIMWWNVIPELFFYSILSFDWQLDWLWNGQHSLTSLYGRSIFSW